ncbi:purple acid phosphatase 18 [Actinidia rufa]|uniref:acid phosphatase n=1 Tax=Actinidia rufa TaxID=165716 RepID=A0A7J0G9G9_9ERIC|nr:purple acid phosphatase 18 [Actinidia rufa]
MDPKFVLLMAVLVTVATVKSDYVRPKPRKNLQFPWDPKPSSQPKQLRKDSPHSYWATGTFYYLLLPMWKRRSRVSAQDTSVSISSHFCCGWCDLGQTGWTKSTLNHIDLCKYDVHLLPGDLSYADYIQSLWDTFGELVQPLASARPWMVTEGNHEKENIILLEDGFQSYNARWKMPFKESGSSSNLYYSFEVAGVHLIMLGSYTDYDEYSDQYRWLKADLLKVDRKRTPWLLVLFHVPWYNSNRAHQGEGDNMKEAMESLLYAAGVDIVFAGHVHAYERSKRVYNGRLDRCGPVHLTIGDGGNREGLAHQYINPQPHWSDFREASFGHGELKVVNSTHSFWSWHRNDDDEPVRSDQVWINSLVSSGCLAGKRPELRTILMAP